MVAPGVTHFSIKASVDPRASEEVRQFLQERLALLGKVTFALSACYLVALIVVTAAERGVPVMLEELTSPKRVLNAAGAVVSLLVWLLARTGERKPIELLALDLAGTVAAAVPYTLMSVLGQPTGRAGVLLTALTMILVLQTRALLVPSDGTRTFAISLTAALLSLALFTIAHLYGWAPPHEADITVFDLSLSLSMWLAVIVAVSTVASRVLFGLREAVREARQLGQYTLLEKLGEGGMGEVYRAKHSLLRRPTAVKLLPPEKSGEGASVRFEREVQLTASLVHPNTVTIFDYGHTPDGVFYYAMEYLDGGDLSTVVGIGGPMPPARVVHILTQVAAGLAEAHEIGLIHRDIKPANILLAAQGPVADLAKLLDFGLVRELDRSGSPELTQSDSLLGTPLYMPPEAITNPAAVDARSDIYSLGAVGYFLLTGQHVFEGSTVVEVCSHHLHTRPIPPSKRLGAKVPEALEEVIMRCLEKDPAARPQSANELRDLLLACGDVGTWRASDARAWWSENRAGVGEHRHSQVPVDPTARTLAVTVADR